MDVQGKPLTEFRTEIELGLHVCTIQAGGQYDGMRYYCFREANGRFALIFVNSADETYGILDEQPTFDGIINFYDVSGMWILEKVPDEVMAHFIHYLKRWQEQEKEESYRAIYIREHRYFEKEDGTIWEYVEEVNEVQESDQ